MTVYLLHFESPLGNRGGHIAQHYLGWTEDTAAALRKRTDAHLYGVSDAKIVQAARERGIEITLVRVWAGATRADEHRLKLAGHHDRHCWRCHLAQAYLLKTQFDAEVDLCPPEPTPLKQPRNGHSPKLRQPAGTPSHTGFTSTTVGSSHHRAGPEKHTSWDVFDPMDPW